MLIYVVNFNVSEVTQNISTGFKRKINICDGSFYIPSAIRDALFTVLDKHTH